MMLPHGFTPCDACKAKLQAAVRAERQRKAARKAPRVAKEREARTARNEGTADLRGRLLDLTGGVCEWCGGMPVPEDGHMHHTEGGGGRVERQHIGNVAWVHATCHAWLHAHPREAKEFRTTIREKRERTGQR